MSHNFFWDTLSFPYKVCIELCLWRSWHTGWLSCEFVLQDLCDFNPDFSERDFVHVSTNAMWILRSITVGLVMRHTREVTHAATGFHMHWRSCYDDGSDKRIQLFGGPPLSVTLVSLGWKSQRYGWWYQLLPEVFDSSNVYHWYFKWNDWFVSMLLGGWIPIWEMHGMSSRMCDQSVQMFLSSQTMRDGHGAVRNDFMQYLQAQL